MGSELQRDIKIRLDAAKRKNDDVQVLGTFLSLVMHPNVGYTRRKSETHRKNIDITSRLDGSPTLSSVFGDSSQPTNHQATPLQSANRSKLPISTSVPGSSLNVVFSLDEISFPPVMYPVVADLNPGNSTTELCRRGGPSANLKFTSALPTDKSPVMLSESPIKSRVQLQKRLLSTKIRHSTPVLCDFELAFRW
ncbi:hypothetical protein HAX54_036639 [Datura stramonium]|uniref:Uncharacterized protein n=1 Tax=Datura stramonium TaxID=4076 RepID=A0ABS8VKF4_DATST|nr:hypothetical protein [Datura stramonium]